MDQQQYEHESECEDYVDYCPEGYHPVVLGQKFNHVYVVVQKLGWGHFSTVWLVQNQNNKEYAALKIQRSKQSHSESAIDEMKILNEIRRHQKDPKWIQQLSALEKLHPEDIHSKLCRPLLMYDNFTHHGIHGKHYCSVFQILGPNLLDLIQHYQFKQERMPLWLVKKITIDVLIGLVYLHEHCNIIHTDLKPENIMIKMEPDEQAQFIENIKKYKVKPISMKYLKNLQASKNSKTKKKNEKKKLKKKLKKEGEKTEEKQNMQQQNEDEPQKSSEPVVQKQLSSQIQEKSKEEVVKKMEQQASQPKEANQKGQKKEEEVDMKILKWKNVKIELNKKLFFKVVDMGNACFANHHYTQDIQTRQYRAPEVILGYSYAHNTDVWSLACTVFEMLTNTFLFKPKPLPGISKDEDHLYKIIEVLGPISKEYALSGTHSSEFFNKKGKLLNGHPKEHIRLNQLLHEDFGYSLQDSIEIEQFLLPMLQIQDSKRVGAGDCLKNEWLWE